MGNATLSFLMNPEINEALAESLAKDRMNEVVRRLKIAGKKTDGIEGDEETFRLFLALERAVMLRRAACTSAHEETHLPDA